VGLLQPGRGQHGHLQFRVVTTDGFPAKTGPKGFAWDCFRRPGALSAGLAGCPGCAVKLTASGQDPYDLFLKNRWQRSHE
jgi:hypothetical protein